MIDRPLILRWICGCKIYFNFFLVIAVLVTMASQLSPSCSGASGTCVKFWIKQILANSVCMVSMTNSTIKAL